MNPSKPVVTCRHSLKTNAYVKYLYYFKFIIILSFYIFKKNHKDGEEVYIDLSIDFNMLSME